MQIMKIPFIYIILCLIPVVIGAQSSKSYRFTHLTIEDGLADNNVSAMHMDEAGFLWIGTNRGLCRFDGHSFKNYTHSSTDSTTISGNIIKTIKEDSEGYFWIGTIGGALNRFDPKTEKFQSFKYIIENPYFEGQDVTSIILDESENLWMGTFSCGFHYFDKSTEKFKRFNINENFETSNDAFNRNTVHSLIEDISNPDLLWIGSSQGLYLFNKKTELLEEIPLIVEGEENTITAILDLHMDKPNELWLGTWRLGLGKFDIETREWQFNIPDKKEYKKNNYFSNVVNQIERKSNDEFWVCSQDQGLLIYNVRSDNFEKISNNPSDQYSILSNQINGMFKDSEQRNWIFNLHQGVSLLDPINQYFEFYKLNQEEDCLKNDARVFDFSLDVKSGHLFITTIGCERLFVFDRNRELQNSIALHPRFITSENGYHLLTASDQSIYLAGGNENEITPSLLTYDIRTKQLREFSHPDLKQVPIHSYKLTGIVEDEEGNIWISTYLGGLIKIDIINNRLKQFVNKIPTPNSIDIRTELNDIKIAHDGNIWIATLQEGVFSFDPKTEKFKHYSSFEDPQKGLRGNRIIAIEEDRHKNVWAGLSSTGIQLIDPEAEDWVVGSYQSIDGLPNEEVWKMNQDFQGNMWLATQYGLCRFDEKNNAFVQYTQPDGVKDHSLFKKGMYFAPNGEMFFGQTNGYCSFFPETIYQNQSPPKIAFTSFRVLDKDYPLEKSINTLEKIELNHNENYFTIVFAALNFTASNKNKYAYKLDGFDGDWKFQSGDLNFANYTKVPPGEYTFYVKAANRENIWSEDEISIIITVNPPIWKTWWAYLGYLLIALSIIRWIYLFQLKKRLAEQEAVHFKNLNDAKTKLFSNITHELRTPLTVVIGSVERARRLNRHLTEKELVLVKNNGEHLLQLINQVLDIEKIDAGAMPMNHQWNDIVAFVKYVTFSYETLVDEKSISIAFEAFPKECQAFYDKDKLSIILSNLISNAIKFTPENGSIRTFLKIKEMPSDRKTNVWPETQFQKLLFISIEDTGIGIEKEQLPFIFNRFYQVDELEQSSNSSSSNTKGTGIGLSLVKELVTLMGGSISVKSLKNKGTSFNMELPIQVQQDPINVEIKTSNEKLPIVLIVDDNISLVRYISAGLRPHFQVLVENNGKDGLEKAFDIIPDVIISDVVMPIMDGLELCENIKNDNRTSHIPVILLTAKTGQESKLKGLKSGADAYLIKPFDEQELLVRINNLLENRTNLRTFYLQNSGISDTTPTFKSRPSNINHKVESEFLNKVKTLMENQVDNPDFNIVFLCKAVGLSNTQLHRKLVALTGQPPIKLMRAIKMNKAKELLISSSLSISEIAFQTGFTDPSYFSKTFKSETGHSPKKYRQKMQ